MVEIIHETIVPSPELGDFESIKRISESGTEFWSARELSDAAGYTRWEYFDKTVDRAKQALTNSGSNVSDHIREAPKMVRLGSGAERQVSDYAITRYGAYLIFMNGDPRKSEIAAAQSYFAVRTREAETRPAPAELSRMEILQLAMDAEQERIKAVDRAEKAETVVRAVESNDGLTIREFHKHYFPDVPERKFFEKLYKLGLLIDQRKKRWDIKNQIWKDGKQHRHPSYIGKAYFYLHGSVDRNGDRWESVRVQPGTPEVLLRDHLAKKGLPPRETKEIAA